MLKEGAGWDPGQAFQPGECAPPSAHEHATSAVQIASIAISSAQAPDAILRPTDPQGLWKDYEFSRTTMKSRWAQGVSDARATLLASPWLAPMPHEVGARTFDVLRDLRLN